jgi:hypothetical protein
MVYGSVYQVPDEIGTVDIVTAGSILLHLRDPFLALRRASALARETVVVTEMLPVFRRRSIPGAFQVLRRLSPRLADRALPDLTFLPDASVRAPSDTWWRLSPGLVGRYLEVLGFPNQMLTYHEQIYNEPTRRDIPMYTVVATK